MPFYKDHTNIIRRMTFTGKAAESSLDDLISIFIPILRADPVRLEKLSDNG